MRSLARVPGILAIPAVLFLGACATGPASGVNDPYEERNRAVHEANKDLDRTVLRPIALTYGRTVPEPVRRGVDNFADNLDLPGIVLNDILQLKLENAVWNASRFLFNTTVGLAGIFDPAASIDLYERDNDFAKTLYVWGVPQGAYVAHPLIGPSTERRTVGGVVDLALNPTRLILSEAELVSGLNTAAGVAGAVNLRFRFGDTIDTIFYDSTDSYVQARMGYLDARRTALGIDPADSYVDPYETYGTVGGGDDR